MSWTPTLPPPGIDPVGATAALSPPQRLALLLASAALLLVAAGLSAGAEGWSLDWAADAELIASIRAPRTLGALFAGALLGLAGALAQGLFRNPLADPYLLGSAAGAGLGVVLVLAAGGLIGREFGPAAASALLRLGLVGAAFAGALGGMLLTLVLARGAGRPMVLLLAGVVVGVLLTALSDLIILLAPEALRGKQVFLLGTTSFFGWASVAWLGAALVVVLPLAVPLARVLDALVLGEASAASLGLALPRLRLALLALVALATGSAVAQAGLVAFVGLVAPHLVRRRVVVTHGALLALSALAGGVLLLAADVAARSVIAPRELPVGLLTAVFGGAYLLALLRKR
ncbi:ABC transporter permease [Rubrivivax sp. A210]|uniref:FecCD family ABC transporter permease n=1 Tax=Rubrivivax sp. A210 TaxID=2772301 RepID=UPI0019188355|nr:iron ABC transporter permease [Rubrivivax sp. A210]CAD5374564.1 ABC transporter permease [Rubrivivax sp. A210]